MQEKFTKFYNGIYSNWHLVDFVDENGLKFNNSEQYMMYHKAMTFNDIEIAELIMLALHPRDQKAFGRQVRNFKPDVWDSISRNVVYKGCYFKFEQNPDLKSELLSTQGTTLVECSEDDKLWGIGFYADAPESNDRSKWNGKNWLGETLTILREDFINNTINFNHKFN
jgi:ribA/ribD-fused uncharacterized protein